MATAGGPLRRRHAVISYSPQVAYGTPVTPATHVGICSPRAMRQSGMEAIFGIGNPNAIFFKPGLSLAKAPISIDDFQEKTFLLQALRSSGVLPWFTLGIGYQDDAGTKYAWQIQDCKIGTVGGECVQKGPLKLNFDITGGLVTEVTNLTRPAALAQKPLRWYEGVVTKGGAAYECTRIGFNVNHNLRDDSPIPGVAPSTNKRGWTYLTEGDEVITTNVTRFAKSGIDMGADTIANAATIILALTDIAGGMTPNSATITLTTAAPDSEEMTPADEFVFGMPWKVASWSVV